jgi:GDPmannose 4,6-dehydratase
MISPKAIITGVSGQDGSFLARSLLNDGYEVFGTSGSGKTPDMWRLRSLGIENHPKLKILDWDITNPIETQKLISEIKPSEIYNLASSSFVADSLFNPQNTTLVSGFAPVNIMEAITSVSPDSRFFQAGSSEMFGLAESSPQNEQSGFSPRNIYGSAKVFAHSATMNYRDNRNLFTTSGILYNHESHLRGKEFVTRKITSAVAKIKLNQIEELKIGNLSSQRDWGYAPEYVEAMRLILSHDTPETFVISSGVPSTVRSFVESAFSAVDIEVFFEGQGLMEVGYEKSTGRKLVSVNKEVYRESEDVTLVGDSSKIKTTLGWHAKTKVAEIVDLMVKSDLNALGGSR